jgi:hypothetical protein
VVCHYRVTFLAAWSHRSRSGFVETSRPRRPVLRKESTRTGRPGNCERRSEKSSEGASELLDKLPTDSAYSMNPDQLAELKADHATEPSEYRRICMKRLASNSRVVLANAPVASGLCGCVRDAQAPSKASQAFDQLMAYLPALAATRSWSLTSSIWSAVPSTITEVVAALVAEARKWIAKRSSPPRMELRTLH